LLTSEHFIQFHYSFITNGFNTDYMFTDITFIPWPLNTKLTKDERTIHCTSKVVLST